MPHERSILTQRSWSVKVIRDFWYAGIWRQVGDTLTVPVNTARGMVEAGNAVQINWPMQSTDNPYALQGVGDPYGWVNTPGINLDNGTCKGSITFDQNCSIIFTDGPDGTGDTLLTLTKQGDISVIFQTSELELINGPCKASIALDPSCDIVFKNGNSDAIATLTQTGDLTVNSLTANNAITTPVLNLSNGTCFDSIGFDASCDIVIADSSGTPLLTITPGGELFTRSNIHSGGNVYADSFIGSSLFVNDGTFYTNVTIGGNLTVTGSISGNITPSGPLTVGTGGSTLAGPVTINGGDPCALIVNGNLCVSGDISNSGNFTTGGNAQVNGNLNVTGEITINGVPISGVGASAGSLPRGDTIFEGMLTIPATAVVSGTNMPRPYYIGEDGWGPWTFQISQNGQAWRAPNNPNGQNGTPLGNGWYMVVYHASTQAEPEYPDTDFALGDVIWYGTCPQGSVTWVDKSVD